MFGRHPPRVTPCRLSCTDVIFGKHSAGDDAQVVGVEDGVEGMAVLAVAGIQKRGSHRRVGSGLRSDSPDTATEQGVLRRHGFSERPHADSGERSVQLPA